MVKNQATNPIRTWAKDMKGHFTKEDMQIN